MPGFVDELVEHSMCADHHPNRTFPFAGALALLAHLAGRKFVGPNDARPNIYLIALADSGGLLWKTLGAKTIKLIHENITSVDIGATLEELVINSAVLDAVITEADAKRKSEEIVKMLHARLGKHAGNPKFKKIADKVEELKEKMRQNLMTSIEFLKQLLEMAKELLDAEKELGPRTSARRQKLRLPSCSRPSRPRAARST